MKKTWVGNLYSCKVIPVATQSMAYSWLCFVSLSISLAYGFYGPSYGDSADTDVSIHNFKLDGWTLYGDAAVHERFVRLVEDRQSKRGMLWSDQKYTDNTWEVEFQFRINGVSKVGADGLAFWYTSQKPNSTGPLFGNEQLFDGLGIIIDTYDNDGKGVHPYTFGLMNDGTYVYDENEHDHTDHTVGGRKFTKGEMNGCTLRMRNLPFPSTLKIQYKNNDLTVLYRMQPGKDFAECFSVKTLLLPNRGYFGFSAATGQLADNHDIYDITIRNFLPEPSARLNSLSADIARIQASLQTDIESGVADVAQITSSSKNTLDALTDVVRGLKDIVEGKELPPPPPGILERLDSAEYNIKSAYNTLQTLKNSNMKEMQQTMQKINEGLAELVRENENSKSTKYTGHLLFALLMSLAACGVLVFFIRKEKRAASF